MIYKKKNFFLRGMEAIMESKEYKDWRNFGIRVKNARNSIGMTTEQLAEKSNRSENYIINCRLKNHVNYTNKSNIYKINLLE